MFDFQTYIADLREREGKKQVIANYELYYENMPPNIRATHFFKKYISQFEIPEQVFNYIKLPIGLEDDFDWKVLCKLILGSLSSDFSFTEPDEKNKVDLLVTVSSGTATVTKSLSELWSFQILRLYEIYIEENINLFKLMAEDKREKEAIEKNQKEKLIRAQKKIEHLLLNFESGNLFRDIV